jgi:AraC family transcriptional regulator, transcriptional activator of pobA
MPFEPAEQSDLSLVTVAQLMQAGSWQLSLAHDRGQHLLIWMTRGQGVALLDGSRRGMGVHNALFIPARSLMALEPGRQGYGTALLIPGDSALVLPRTPQHLRIRDVSAQSELTQLMEALGREQTARRPLCQSAMMAHAELVAIWLHRNLARQMDQDPPAPRDSAARRLSRAWCARLVSDYASPASMADHAAALGVTPTHLTRVCRAETGRTAARLLSERQLHAAHQLLIATRVPVLDIARHLGFGSAAYFTRFIRQHTGETPTRLRQIARSRQLKLPAG